MQQLQAKLKNIPADASQVRCSISIALNKEEIPSVKKSIQKHFMFNSFVFNNNTRKVRL